MYMYNYNKNRYPLTRLAVQVPRRILATTTEKNV